MTSKLRRWPVAASAATAVALAVVIGVAALQQPASARAEVALGGIENAMGTNRYAPLMSACRETVLVALGHHSSELRIVEAPLKAGERPDYVLQQRWVFVERRS